ncbi:maleylpyruvate isomerase N-terminal domain-containing protein [Pseudonocardia alaniniphila]|uniref:Maleylpyruvate isomerase N-terminal domain-containing protein n=1 Tax=Pseudonocardia alaniniphila TaxID=75291 RepID=A0ABS9TTX4_9PSEU|nr:maleylpyruvate isomerase N-terminal domain-containing protein [Pseudonocardia alaniniphila]MCH6171952.1 maleylpyruvate isomerase N-terminal domain-containing protein [Pseudonocardia alaniniphila]
MADSTVRTLSEELNSLERILAGLSSEEWAASTRLIPVDEDLPHWTILELAGHLEFAMNMVDTLIDGESDEEPQLDPAGFFLVRRSEVAPIAYQHAYQTVGGRSADQMRESFSATCSATVKRAEATSPDLVGPALFGPMRLDDFLVTRVVEAVVHGLDLTQALDREPVATSAGIEAAAAVLDELLVRRAAGQRPADLSDDWKWVEAAAGRVPHGDQRLPLLG